MKKNLWITALVILALSYIANYIRNLHNYLQYAQYTKYDSFLFFVTLILFIIGIILLIISCIFWKQQTIFSENTVNNYYKITNKIFIYLSLIILITIGLFIADSYHFRFVGNLFNDENFVLLALFIIQVILKLAKKIEKINWWILITFFVLWGAGGWIMPQFVGGCGSCI